MNCIIYLSDTNIAFSELDLQNLANHAALKNQQLGVTGFMCFSRNRFLQYLEGDETVIQTLYDEIKTDTRHEIIYQLQDKAINERLFSSWGMRLMSNEDLRKFNLELQIEQHMLYLKNDFWFKERSEEAIWKYIMQLSKFSQLLKIYGD